MIDAAVRQNTALRGRRIKGPVRRHERESFFDIASVSRANQDVSMALTGGRCHHAGPPCAPPSIRDGVQVRTAEICSGPGHEHSPATVRLGLNPNSMEGRFSSQKLNLRNSNTGQKLD